MRIETKGATINDLLAGGEGFWGGIERTTIPLFPAPVELAAVASPYVAQLKGYGVTASLEAQAIATETVLAIRILWRCDLPSAKIDDADRFIDGAAVMFPLHPEARAMTMGSAGHPINGWMWRADKAEPFDVVAHGIGRSERYAGAASQLQVRGSYHALHWEVVWVRPLVSPVADRIGFEKGKPTGIAFAIWQGAHRERAGQKAISGEFLPLPWGNG